MLQLIRAYENNDQLRFTADQEFLPIRHSLCSELIIQLLSANKLCMMSRHFRWFIAFYTIQEFLFKYYLRSRYPDLLIIFPPFNHDKNAETTASLLIRLQYFLSLMDLYVPDDVQVRSFCVVVRNSDLDIGYNHDFSAWVIMNMTSMIVVMTIIVRWSKVQYRPIVPLRKGTSVQKRPGMARVVKESHCVRL